MPRGCAIYYTIAILCHFRRKSIHYLSAHLRQTVRRRVSLGVRLIVYTSLNGGYGETLEGVIRDVRCGEDRRNRLISFN